MTEHIEHNVNPIDTGPNEPRRKRPSVREAMEDARPENGRAECLQDAAGAVLQDRNSSYGDPEDNFRLIKRLINPYLQEKYGTDIEIDEIDVAMIANLIKVARAANDPLHLDNYVDGAGYNACAHDIAQSRKLKQEVEELSEKISKGAREDWGVEVARISLADLGVRTNE